MFTFYKLIIFVAIINETYQNVTNHTKKFIYNNSETKYVFSNFESVDLYCGNKFYKNMTWYRPPRSEIFTGHKLRIKEITKLDYGTYFCTNGTSTKDVIRVKKVILLPNETKQRERSVDEEVQYIEILRPKGREIRYVPGEVKDMSDIVTWEHPPGTILLDQGREFYIDSYNKNHTRTFFYYRINRKGDYLINKVGKIFISEWQDKEVQVFVEGVVSYGAELKVTCFPSLDMGNNTKVIWRRKNKIIHQGYTYIIKKYEEESFGNYICEFQKKGVTIKRRSINLTPEKDLQLKIEMTSELEKYYNFQIGKNKQIHCKIFQESGKNKYSSKDIIWTFKGRIISKEFVRLDLPSKSILTLMNMDQNNEGNYKCFQGFSTLTVNLLMERKDIFLKISPEVKTVNHNVNDFVEFGCEINTPGVSAKLIKWSFKSKMSKDEEQLPKDEEQLPKEAEIKPDIYVTSYLTIENPLKRHEGIYICQFLKTKVFAILNVKVNSESTLKPSIITMDPFPKQNFFCQRTNLDEDVFKNKEYMKKRKMEGNSKSSLERNEVKSYRDDTIYECNVNSQNHNQRYDIEIGKIERRQMSAQILEMINNYEGLTKEMKQQNNKKNNLLLTIKEEIKEQSKNIKEELEILKSELNKYKNETKSQSPLLKKLLLTIKEEMQGQSKNIKDELESLKSELNEYKNETKLQLLKIKESSHNKTNLLLTIKEEMKGQSKNIKDELETLKSELNKYKNKTESILIESSHNQTEIKKIILKEKCKNVKNITEWIKCLNINVDFIWKINQISQKKGQNLFSKPFYSNNYKLRLYYYNYNDYYLFGFSIMRGDNDERAEWPLRLRVTLSTMNQVSLRPQCSETLSYDTHPRNKGDFERPKSEQNYEIFTKISKNDHSLSVFEDSLIIYCVVTPP